MSSNKKYLYTHSTYFFISISRGRAAFSSRSLEYFIYRRLLSVPRHIYVSTCGLSDFAKEIDFIKI